MKKTTLEIQTELLRRNYDPGPLDDKMGRRTTDAVRAFQQAQGLYVDGDPGPKTLAKLFPETVKAEVQVASTGSDIPKSWMPKASILGIVVHWTAGQHHASSDDRKHYHVLWEADGTAVRGIPTIDKNDASGIRTGYAAHTLSHNTGQIGVSMCCMLDAIELPFSPGPAPMTRAQWDAMIRGVAVLAKNYGVPITDDTVLTHAEVQPNLGIRQKGKWDVTRLAFDKSVVGHRAVGDLLRRQVAALL